MKNLFSKTLPLIMLLFVCSFVAKAQSVDFGYTIRSDDNITTASFLDTFTAVDTSYFVVKNKLRDVTTLIFTINTVENIAATFTGSVVVEAQYTYDSTVPWQDADDLEVVSGTVDANAVEGNAQSFQVEDAVGYRYRLRIINATATTNVLTVGVRALK